MSILRHLVMTGVGLGLVLAGPLSAQSRLYVLEGGTTYHPVLKVSGGRPCIMENGKLVAATGRSFILRKVEEYLPVCVTVRDKEAGTTILPPADLSAAIKNRVFFGAKFEAPCMLEEVFLVLELEFPNAGKSLFVHEIGRLEPGRPKPFSMDMQLEQNLGPCRFTLHLYAGGTEVFHSGQPAAHREEALDRLIARRIARVRQADPRPYYGSLPEYPAGLGPAGTRGQVLVTMRVTPRGTVEDPVIERTSDPAFGEAALAAARQWRFLPRVENGRAIASRVSMPITFDPPKTATVADH